MTESLFTLRATEGFTVDVMKRRCTGAFNTSIASIPADGSNHKAMLTRRGFGERALGVLNYLASNVFHPLPVPLLTDDGTEDSTQSRPYSK